MKTTRRTWLRATLLALGAGLAPWPTRAWQRLPRLRTKPLRRADLYRAHPWRG